MCALTGCKPVGSPITAALALGRPSSAIVLAPCIDVSSSAVASTISGSLKSRSIKGFMASIMMGKKPFISVIPKPYIFPSLSKSRRGSKDHSSSSKGTVSVWPAKTNPPGPDPRVAIRLHFLIFVLDVIISHEKPRDSKDSAKKSITLLLLMSNSRFVELTLGKLMIFSSCANRVGIILAINYQFLVLVSSLNAKSVFAAIMKSLRCRPFISCDHQYTVTLPHSVIIFG